MARFTTRGHIPARADALLVARRFTAAEYRRARAVRAAHDEIVVDLAALARVRALGRFRTTDFPALYRLPGVRQGSEPELPVASEGLRLAVAAAISLIPDDGHRHAASAIFSFDARRWSALRVRQSEAAHKLGVGLDAYRRRRSGCMSLYAETLCEMAIALTRIDDTTGEGTPISSQDQGTDAGYPSAPLGGRPSDYRQFVSKLRSADYTGLASLAESGFVEFGRALSRYRREASLV